MIASNSRGVNRRRVLSAAPVVRPLDPGDNPDPQLVAGTPRVPVAEVCQSRQAGLAINSCLRGCRECLDPHRRVLPRAGSGTFQVETAEGVIPRHWQLGDGNLPEREGRIGHRRVMAAHHRSVGLGSHQGVELSVAMKKSPLVAGCRSPFLAR